ncbi:ribonuclease H-like domain-containing protein [Tanacetum coccineum]
MNGHTADRGFDLVGYPPKFKKNIGTNKGFAGNNVVSGIKDQSIDSSNFFTNDQYKRLMALISEKSGSSSMPTNIVGINCVINFCSSRVFNHNSNISSYKIYIGWIIDSGASQHMTYTILNTFNVVDVSKLNMTVGHPNGTKALVTHVGSLKLTKKIVIHDVLAVPGYQVNLLSVHRLSKDNKFRVIFYKDTCVVQDFVLKTQVGTGNESNGLYQTWSSLLDIIKHKLNFETSSKEDLCKAPSFVLSGKSLYEMIFKTEPNLSHLKVFGCLCFSTVLNNADKFSSMSENSEYKDYDLELKNLNGLNFFNIDLEDNLSSEPYDDGRDSRSDIGKGTNQLSQGGTENTCNARRGDEGNPDDSIPAEANCDNLESAILDDKYNESKGDDTAYQEFNDQFQSPILNPDSQSVNLRRSTRKLAASDIRWIEAINQEMEALNRNGTWVITYLPIGRKPIGSKWVFKVKYKSSGEVERFKARLVAKGFESLRWEYSFNVGICEVLPHRCVDLRLAGTTLWYMHAPLQSHLKLAFKVLRYLKIAHGKGLSFVKGNDLELNVFVDFDWAKCKATTKSVTGYSVFLGKSLISWKSKKQSMLAKSSIEAEYRAMNTVTCEVIWIQKILSKLNIKLSLPILIYCDNSSVIQIAANLVFHEKTKHFEIKLFFLREKVSTGVVKTVKIKSADNLADVFTNGLSIQDHNKFCDMLGLFDMYKS